MRIRVMHVVDSLGQGGLENGLANVIVGSDPDCFEHIVLALRRLGPTADRLLNHGVQVECLERSPRRSRFQAFSLTRAIRSFRPDIVHSRNWGAIEGVVAGRGAGFCSVIHSEHGIETAVTAKEPWRRVAFRRLTFELADRVLSVSGQLRDLHARRTGFPARKITVIHNGVDSGRFVPDPGVRARVRSELGLGDRDFCIGCVGNLLPVKDHLTLLRAASLMAETKESFRLLMLGVGPELPKLRGFLDNNAELREKVCFLGSCMRVPEMLNAMDAYVLCSVSEGMSNSLLEAMATGLAVAVTETGGNPEAVIDNDSGLLFPVGDSEKLAELLLLLRARKDLREALGQRALARVREHFSLQAMVRNYERIYEGVATTSVSRVFAGV